MGVVTAHVKALGQDRNICHWETERLRLGKDRKSERSLVTSNTRKVGRSQIMEDLVDYLKIAM